MDLQSAEGAALSIHDSLPFGKFKHVAELDCMKFILKMLKFGFDF